MCASGHHKLEALDALTSQVSLLVIVCFLFEYMFGDYLLPCFFVLIIFVVVLFVPLLVCLCY
jgi:hypothetical protein